MAKLSSSQKEFLMEASRQYRKSVKGSPAEEYLASRGLLQYHKKYSLGYVAEPLEGHKKYRGMLAIPYIRTNPKGEVFVVTIRFRCIQDHDHKDKRVCGQKYRSMPGDTPRLFNTVELTKDHDVIAITEGEMDAIVATECGIPTVSAQGVKSWKPHFSVPFQGYEKVLVLADNDDSRGEGYEFGKMLAAEIPNVKIVEMLRGHDVNSLVHEYGPEKLHELVNQ